LFSSKRCGNAVENKRIAEVIRVSLHGENVGAGLWTTL